MFERKRTPVPGIHKCRWRFTFYYRHFRTFQERRLNQEGWARAKRIGKNLPDVWDDLPRCRQRGWKVQGKRCKQWGR